MITLELAPEFLLAEGVPLDAEDLRYGFEHGFLKAPTVIDLAGHEVRQGSEDPILLALAALLRDEVDRVREVLEALEDPERVHDPRESARKWLYLQLKAAYVNRSQLADPLGLVEQLYTDFDYPPAVAPFVRYMPLRPGDATGAEKLMQRWRDFLDREKDALGGR